jgi:hypothetical protein
VRNNLMGKSRYMEKKGWVDAQGRKVRRAGAGGGGAARRARAGHEWRRRAPGAGRPGSARPAEPPRLRAGAPRPRRAGRLRSRARSPPAPAPRGGRPGAANALPPNARPTLSPAAPARLPRLPTGQGLRRVPFRRQVRRQRGRLLADLHPRPLDRVRRQLQAGHQGPDRLVRPRAGPEEGGARAGSAGAASSSAAAGPRGRAQHSVADPKLTEARPLAPPIFTHRQGRPRAGAAVDRREPDRVHQPAGRLSGSPHPCPSHPALPSRRPRGACPTLRRAGGGRARGQQQQHCAGARAREWEHPPAARRAPARVRFEPAPVVPLSGLRGSRRRRRGAGRRPAGQRERAPPFTRPAL